MNWPTDTLTGIFLFLFAFGLIFSLVTFFLGAVAGHIHLPGGIHLSGHEGHVGDAGYHGNGGAEAGGHGHGAAGGHTGSATFAPPSPFNLNTLMIFLTWFGATGYVLRVYYGSVAAWSLIAATIVGLVGASIVYFIMARVLWRGQTQLDPLDYVIEGTPARVTSSIRAGGTGEIVYMLDEKRMVDSARGIDGVPIPSGTDVMIMRYESGIAYVCPLDQAPNISFPLGDLGEEIGPIEARH